jgi:hypothetical protein
MQIPQLSQSAFMVIRYFESGARKRLRVRLGSGKVNWGICSAIETVPINYDPIEIRVKRIANCTYQIEK